MQHWPDVVFWWQTVGIIIVVSEPITIKRERWSNDKKALSSSCDFHLPSTMHFSAFPPSGYGFFVLSFLTLSRPYNFARVCLNCEVKQGIACTTELLCLMNFFVLQVYKSNEYNNNFLNCNCQQMTLKQDNVHFVVCPKQGNEIEGIVSKNCLSWRCFILNSRWGFQTLSDSPLAKY